jgi:hypothetical protein
MFLETRCTLVSALCVLALAALPSAAPAQGTASSQRLFVLQQQNAFQQQQSAVQNAVQQTAILAQAANRQNGVPVQTGIPLTLNFQQQAFALQVAMQQTRALLQSSQSRNAALHRTALGQLNSLQAVVQQSTALQAAFQRQNHLLTPAQVSRLSQEQTSLSSLLVGQPTALPTNIPGVGGR